MPADPANLLDGVTQLPEWRTRRERGSIGLLRFMAFVSLRLGRRISRVVLYAIATYFFLFAPAARRYSKQYLRMALGHAPTLRDRFRQMLYFSTTIHDRVFLLNDQQQLFDITTEGEQLMFDQVATGRGAVIMGAHMGSFEVLRSLGRRRAGLQVAMAMYEQNARKINAAMAVINPKIQADIVPLGRIDAMLRIAERLDGGQSIGFLSDRVLGDEPTLPVTVLGERAHIPTGPMRAAAILKRPVIFMVGLHRGGNRYHVVFELLADFSRVTPKSRELAVRTALDRYAQLLDRHCRNDPYNWFNFYDFWRDPKGGTDA